MRRVEIIKLTEEIIAGGYCISAMCESDGERSIKHLKIEQSCDFSVALPLSQSPTFSIPLLLDFYSSNICSRKSNEFSVCSSILQYCCCQC